MPFKDKTKEKDYRRRYYLEHKINKCVDCGVKIDNHAQRCGSCASKVKIRHFSGLRKKTSLRKQKEPLDERKERKREKQRAYNKTHREQLKEWRKKNREKLTIRLREWRKKYPERAKAHNLIRNIELTEPFCCEICGAKDFLDKHHPDYNQPLNFVILCKSCHKRLHNTLKLIKIPDTPVNSGKTAKNKTEALKKAKTWNDFSNEETESEEITNAEVIGKED